MVIQEREVPENRQEVVIQHPIGTLGLSWAPHYHMCCNRRENGECVGSDVGRKLMVGACGNSLLISVFSFSLNMKQGEEGREGRRYGIVVCELQL